MASKGMGQEATPFPVGLQSTRSQGHRYYVQKHGVQEKAMSGPWPVAWGSLRQGATHDQLHYGTLGMNARRPSLCPSTSKSEQRQDEGLLGQHR
jgi:hypothetical protein